LDEGSGFDTDAQAYFGEVGLTDPTYAVPINQFVLDLKLASLWTPADRIRLYANKNETAALTCIKSLAVATTINGPTFTAGQGYAGNASNSYIDSGFAPASGVNYQRDSAAIIAYCRGGTATGGFDISASNAGSTVSTLVFRFSDGIAYGSNNTGNTNYASAAAASPVGLYFSTRTDANTQILYKDDVQIGTGTQTSTGRTSQNFYEGCRNANGTPDQFTNRQLSFVAYYGGLTASDVTAFKAAFDTLRATMGF
jgi:hypothetical protein